MAANRCKWCSGCQLPSRLPEFVSRGKSWLYDSEASVLKTDVMVSMSAFYVKLDSNYLLSLSVDVCCISGTRIQDRTLFMHLKPSKTISDILHFTLRVPRGLGAMAHGIFGLHSTATMKVPHWTESQ
ncbi:hypothetical protein T265_08838 [Opisthorchis viverrini]|uniref:Uncharacterized protein n=1 Tax=Opisthorchis viverrini TaxID=6198 RepID=A0A075A725_OPIVI|nr:hypothetical protein T265_08838 [Opisthorchis viverrini]KER23224.1 hypothetical protein T265_08838 [Opisthorchis viverrini]